MTVKDLIQVAPGALQGNWRKRGQEGFRLVGPDKAPIKNTKGDPIDGGGFTTQNAAEMRKQEIDEYYAKQARQSSED